MGFRYHKSKSFGPVRITASKRGLSASVGGRPLPGHEVGNASHNNYGEDPQDWGLLFERQQTSLPSSAKARRG
ncbi:DUF4236 domain-containing protein [Pseudarthrobacter sp. AG30]|uniref:DUF4236 domain-containing protein n=1 Tax=Pseudarthrobacter sp. AG30 TaxID=2249742 RepID=UPI0034CF6E0A